jgi:RNA polymerase sigma-70 factor (ECF subfamily)
MSRGRAAWPQLTVDERGLVGAIARALRDAGDASAAIDELFVEDLYLARACVSQQPAAIAAFGEMCDGVLRGSLRAMHLSDDLIEELTQDVRAKLLVGESPRIATYSGRAPLKAWLRTVVTRAAVDRIRAHDEPTAGEDELIEVPAVADGPELEHFRRTYHVEFKTAFEEALATLEVRERNVLRHHFVDGLTTEEIGALYGVHKTTAFRWLEAARTALSKRTRAGFQARLHALPAELDSILRLLQSHLDLSLSRVLAS